MWIRVIHNNNFLNHLKPDRFTSLDHYVHRIVVPLLNDLPNEVRKVNIWVPDIQIRETILEPDKMDANITNGWTIWKPNQISKGQDIHQAPLFNK